MGIVSSILTQEWNNCQVFRNKYGRRSIVQTKILGYCQIFRYKYGSSSKYSNTGMEIESSIQIHGSSVKYSDTCMEVVSNIQTQVLELCPIFRHKYRKRVMYSDISMGVMLFLHTQL